MSERAALHRRALLQGSAVASAAAVIAVAGGKEAVAAGQPAQIAAVPATVQNIQENRYSSAITTFGTAITEGVYADCAVVFIAADSGRAMIHWSGALRNLADYETSAAYLSPEVRTGGTVGSGTVVLAASDARTVRCNLVGVQTIRVGVAHLVSGLTPGATYNVRMLHRVTSNVGEYFYRSIIVAPAS